MKRSSGYMFSFASFVILLLVWELFAGSARINFLFGSPSAIGKLLLAESYNGNLLFHFYITGSEALLGFIIGVSSGTLLGFSLWYSPILAQITRPYLLLLGAIPVFAFAPLVIVWFGIGFGMKVAMAALGTFLIALTQSYEGAQNVNLEQLQLLKMLSATRLQILHKVIFPSSLVWVFNSMRLNVSGAVLGAFIGEYISAQEGLGYFMIRAGSLYDIPKVFAGGIYLAILALVFHGLLHVVERNYLGIIKAFTVDRKARIDVL